MKKNSIIPLLITSFFLMGSATSTPEKEYYLFEEYQASSLTETFPFDETIVHDGRTYQLSNDEIQTEVIASNLATVTKKYEKLESKQVENNIVEEDVSYNLKDVSYEDIEFEDGMTTAKYQENYGFKISQPNASTSKEYEYTMNGKTYKTVGHFTGFSSSEEKWQDGFSFNGNYLGDEDVLYYSFNGTLIPAHEDGSVPYQGYEETILNSIGLSTNNTIINDAKWISSSSNSKTAVFNCSQFGRTYIANYVSNVPLIKSGYNATATYELENSSDAYTLKASAKYILIEDEQTISPVIIFIGVLFLAAAIIVAIMYIFAKRKKKEETKEN